MSPDDFVPPGILDKLATWLGTGGRITGHANEIKEALRYREPAVVIIRADRLGRLTHLSNLAKSLFEEQ